MKKVLCLLLASLMIFAGVPVFAEEAPLEYDEFYYVIQGDCAVITGLIKGSDRYAIMGNQSGVEKRVLNQSVLTVPYTIDGKRVELEEGAFRGENGFRKIVFEEGITYIPDYLCCEMPNLEEVVLPASLVEIGSYAFKDTKLKSIDLKTVEKIGKYAFYGCELKEIKIPDTVTEIGFAAFFRLNLESMEIGSGFNITNNWIFTSTWLSKIQVSENNPYIKSIDDVVYDKAGERLITYPAGKTAASFNIPEGVKIIESGAFKHTNFESITVPKSVTKFCDDATDGVEAVYYMGTREEWDKIVIENNNFNLERAVVYCENNEVKNIYGNLRLQEKEDVVLILGLVDETEKSVTIPGEINGKRTQLQSSAFYNTDIVTVTLDERIKTIPYNAFGLCSKLENINLENVEHVESQAFIGCSSLKEVNLLNIKSWDGIGQDRLNLDTMEFELLLNPNMLTYDSSSFYTIFYDANIETLRIKWPEENFAEGEETFPALFLNCNINTVVFENFTISPSPAEFCGIDPSGRNKEIDPYVDLVGVSEELVICGNDEKVQEYAKAIGATFKRIIGIKVDGEALYTDTVPYIKNDRTLVPMRAIFEALGAEVSWDNETRTAIGVKDGIEVKITIGENVLYKNGEAIELDCAAEITNDRTMVPVRAISEAFGCRVDWDNDTKTVNVLDLYNRTSAKALESVLGEESVTSEAIPKKTKEYEDWFTWRETMGAYMQKKTETDYGTIVEWSTLSYSKVEGSKVHTYMSYVRYDGENIGIDAPMFDETQIRKYKTLEISDNGKEAVITYPETENEGTVIITVDLVNCTTEKDVIPYANTNDTDN